MAMSATLSGWPRGEETASTGKIVRLEDIPTWTELYVENMQDFANTLSGIEELTQYAEDPEINSKVSIFGADMTSLEVDGIVRSTDTKLTAREGISGVIKKAAGPQLDAELITLGGCTAGEAKTTSGYNLPANYIVHTVGTKKESRILERCYKSCLEQMRLKNMKSLAFCCISTGTQGYPNDKAVLVALKTVRVWLEKMKTENELDEIDRIIFCLFSEEDVLLYSIWMQIFFPSAYEPERTSTVTSAPNSIASIQLEERGLKVLRPLPGFIKLTTEPDMINYDDDPTTMRAKMPCGHVMGPDSMTDYAQDILKNGRFKFFCPAPSCNREWEYFLVRHVACLSDEEMRQFEKTLEKNFLQKENGRQTCPGCKTWCMRVPDAGNCVRCPICTANGGKVFDFCWSCLKDWKGFQSSGPCGNPGCDGKDKRIQILANCLTKRIDYCHDCPTIRGCPQCGILIEHRDQCGHVSCNNCGFGFCFICLKEKKDGNWQCKPYLGTCNLVPRQTSLPGSE